MLVKLECYFDQYRKAWESVDGMVFKPKCLESPSQVVYYGHGTRIDLKKCINCPYLRGWLQKEEDES